MPHAAARKAAAAFLLVIIAWAGVTAAALSGFPRLCAPVAACEWPWIWLVALSVAATLASLALARWGARYFQRPMPAEEPEPEVTPGQDGAQQRRAAEVLRRMRSLQEALKSRRAGTG